MKKIFKSVRHAFHGLSHAYRHDKSFRMEVWGASGFLVVGAVLFPLSGLEVALLSFSYGLILITELINTSIEQMLARVHPEEHALIGRSKDIAAGSVLIAFIIAGVLILALCADRAGVLVFV